MRSARLRAAPVLLTVVGLLATPWAEARAATSTPTPPTAEGGLTGSIGIFKPVGSAEKRRLNINFSASELVGGTAQPLDISPEGATVTVQPANGTAVPRAASVKLASDEARNPTVILGLDVSGSMIKPDSSKLEAEKKAALAFVNDLPNDTRVGIVGFGAPATVLLRPTRSLNRVRTTIESLPEDRDAGTALYKAITLGAQQLGGDAQSTQRLLVMVTDGNDATTDEAKSRIDKNAARKVITEGQFLFRGVIIGGKDQNDLKNVARDGEVLVDDGATDVTKQLKQVFTNSNEALSKEALLTVPLSPDVSGSVTLSVNARTTDGRAVQAVKANVLLVADPGPPTASNQATAPVGAIARPSWINLPVMLGALLAVFLAITLLLTSATGALAGRGSDQETPVSKALSFYSVRAGRPERVAVPDRPGSLSGSRLARTAINAINRVARQRKLDQALDARLEGAGLPIRTAEWSLLHIGSGIGGGLLLLVATRGAVLGAILGLVLGLAGPWVFLAMRKSRRETRFLAQLPDTLQLLAGSLAAGYSLPQAMDAVVREAQPPIREEFNRALVETRLGMPPEDSLDGIADRTASRDFSWIVMAIRIQRDVGGNLAELLSTVAETLRERERLRRQVKALSAEGRLSGLILGCLPLVFALFLIFTKPDYIAPLFQTPLGLLLLAAGSAMLVVGGVWMAKVVNVEV